MNEFSETAPLCKSADALFRRLAAQASSEV